MPLCNSVGDYSLAGLFIVCLKFNWDIPIVRHTRYGNIISMLMLKIP